MRRMQPHQSLARPAAAAAATGCSGAGMPWSALLLSLGTATSRPFAPFAIASLVALGIFALALGRLLKLQLVFHRLLKARKARQSLQT